MKPKFPKSAKEFLESYDMDERTRPDLRLVKTEELQVLLDAYHELQEVKKWGDVRVEPVDTPIESGWYFVFGKGYLYCDTNPNGKVVVEFMRDTPKREVWKDKWYKVSDNPLEDGNLPERK